METTLIAKVLAPDTDGCDSVGTAYPISKDWVLTARHVVAFDNPVKGVRDITKPIRIVWEQIPDPDNPNDREKFYTVEVNQSDIEFFQDDNGEILDVALIKCKAPPQAHISPLLLSDRHPVTNEQWESRGYALLGKNDKGQWLHEPAGGEVLSPDTSIPILKLTSKADAKNKNDWQGISGAPVFKGQALIAVLTDTPKDRGECFIAVSIPYLLRNVARFRELTGVGQCDYTFNSAIKILQENREVQTVLFKQIGQNPNLADSPAKIIEYLKLISIPKLINTIHQAQKNTSDKAIRKVLARLLREMLPSLYDHACVSTMRASKGNSVAGIIKIPYATDVSAEMLMASVDNRPADFWLIPIDINNPERKQAIPGCYKLALPPESGVTTGSQTVENVSDDLFNRLTSGYSMESVAIAVDEHLFKTIPPKQASRNYTATDKKKLIKSALERDAKNQKPGYYWIWNIDDENDQYGFKQLADEIKTNYPTIILLRLEVNTDREIEENDWFDLLPDTLDE